MEHQLEYQKASKSHLAAWEGMKKTIVWCSASIVILMALLAFFFGG